MNTPGNHTRESSMTSLLEAAGIHITDEGKARARRRLAEADAHWTAQRRDEVRRQLGLPTSAAA